MRHVRMLGLCLLAVFALGAYAVSSASALPEWGKCEAQAGGKYEDKNCTVKATGKTGKHSYEWHKGKTLSPVKFTGHNVGSGGVLTAGGRICYDPATGETARTTRAKCKQKGWTEEELGEEGLAKVECEGETSSGEATGQNSITNIHVTFKGCALFGVFPCNSAGQAAGEVDTNLLKGYLGYISKPKKEVGVLLEPAAKHGRFAEFLCGGFDEVVVGVGNSKEGAQFEPESKGGYDEIISPITPVNQMTGKYTQVYSIESKFPFLNIPSKFEGKHLSALESYTRTTEENVTLEWAGAGEEITNVNTPEEEGEIRA